MAACRGAERLKLRSRRRPWAIPALSVALLASAGCVPLQQQIAAQHAPAPAEHSLRLVPTSFDHVPGWRDDKSSEALATFLGNCRALVTLPADTPLGGQGDAQARGGAAALWGPPCEAAKNVPPGNDAAAQAFFEANFDANEVTDAGSHAEPDRGQGLFTGYFDPEVAGSRSPGGKYQSPLLSRPGDLVQVDLGDFIDDMRGRAVVGRVQDGKLVPYYDRAQIDGGVLTRKRLELLWLSDPVDVYFLQVQGSGRVILPNGKVVRVTYAGQNGRRSVLIGKVLADRGAIPMDQLSLQSIHAWLSAHPAEVRDILNQNPSYVFFREIDDLRPDQGPPGALGVPLTPGRSVAVDRTFLPLGAPVFVATTDPVTQMPWRRLTIAQDVGGAIRGPVRTDIFFGWGHDAEDRAGRMRSPGTEYLLLPKQQARIPTAALP
jgi:membrane-bound lytic murein transglycosylase A